MSTPRRFFFVHLQKTAGTALLKRLRHHFGADAVYPPPGERGSPAVVLDTDLLRDRDAQEPGKFQVFTGHFPLCAVDLLPGHFATFTVLRDPVERVLSFLRHQGEVEPRFAGWSLEEIYADPIATGPLVADHMVRMLSMTVEEMNHGALTPLVIHPSHVERAEQNLVERIDVVGIQEHFDVFCTDLESAFGWDLGPALFMNRTTPSSASTELRERIAEDNSNDQQLYEFAVDLWQQRRPPV